MYTHIKKKIIKFVVKLTDFVHKNLVQIIIIGGVFVFLQLIKAFPYVNIIPNYQFLVIGFTLLLTVILFKILIPNKNIVLVVLTLFMVAAFATIFELAIVADLIGFVIYILLLIVLRQIIRDRKEFKKETSE